MEVFTKKSLLGLVLSPPCLDSLDFWDSPTLSGGGPLTEAYSVLGH